MEQVDDMFQQLDELIDVDADVAVVAEEEVLVEGEEEGEC